MRRFPILILITSAVALGTGGCSASASSPVDGGAPRDATTDVRLETDAGAPLDPTFFDSCSTAAFPDAIFQCSNPDPARINISALRQLLGDAVTTSSDSVIVAVGDTIIAHKCFTQVPEPATVQSITKSVVSLAIGALVDAGKVASLDEPVSTFFPEWTDGYRALVTVRHLLTQTSGLVDEVLDGGTSPLFAASDALAYARSQQPATQPGSTFNYCNVGLMLLGGIIEQAAGKEPGAFIEEQFFTPMGITDATWSRDQAGHAMTPGGLHLAPLDLLRLARLGRLGGRWQSTPLVSSNWLTSRVRTRGAATGRGPS